MACWLSVLCGVAVGPSGGPSSPATPATDSHPNTVWLTGATTSHLPSTQTREGTERQERKSTLDWARAPPPLQRTEQIVVTMLPTSPPQLGT